MIQRPAIAPNGLAPSPNQGAANAAAVSSFWKQLPALPKGK